MEREKYWLIKKIKYYVLVIAVILLLIHKYSGKVMWELYRSRPNEEKLKRWDENRTIKGPKGIFKKPCLAYIDGIENLNSIIQTKMKIDIWADSKRSKKLCVLEHGTYVWIVLKDKDDDEMVFIEKRDCKGWISVQWLIDNPREPQGEIIQF